VQYICGGIIGIKLIDKLLETVNVILHRRILADAIELTQKELMLVAIQIEYVMHGRRQTIACF